MSNENSAIKKLQSEFFSIENRSDITDDEKVTQIIKITSVVCAGLAIQPIPFADIFILTPISFSIHLIDFLHILGTSSNIT